MDTVRHLMARKKYGPAAAFLVFFLLCSFQGMTADTKAEHEPGDVKSRAFARIAVSAAALQNISSDFVQEKHLAMMKNPLISSGRFIYEKPDRLSWEFRRPSPAGFIIHGDRAKRWSNDPGLSQTFELEKDQVVRAIVEQVFAWARADFPWLEKRYRITVAEDAPTLLKLVPLSSREKKYVSRLLIAFTEDWGHVKSVEIHEKGGDYTRILFSSIVVNQPLPKDVFGQ